MIRYGKHVLDYKYQDYAFNIATNYVISTHEEAIKIHLFILGIIYFGGTE